MKVKILRIEDNASIDAEIIDPKLINITLPSMVDGWRFNFKKHSKTKRFQTYVLVCEETPEIVEGCLIFEMKDKIDPYMAFIEIAPHNRGENKKYEKVAGCLIAFACKLSYMQADQVNRGYLTLDVIEENKEDEIKLMALYSLKYGALRFDDTGMVIPPTVSRVLIEEFLN